MNLQRHLMLTTALRSPDEPAAPEPVVTDAPAPEVVAAEPVAEPEAEPLPEPAPEPAPQQQPHGNTGKSPWFLREIAQVREEKRQERTAREAAEQRAADLQAIIERLQAGEAPPAAAPKAPAAPVVPAQGRDFEAAVRAETARVQMLNDTTAVRAAGEAKFTNFGETLAILNAVGATNDEFVADLLAVDKTGAHEVLDRLAKDPEKAASMVGMDSRRRIAELTRMSDALKAEAKTDPKTDTKPAAESAAKPAAAVSRAPAPKPAISPLAPAPAVDPTTAEGNDKMSDAEFEQWYKAKYMKRA